MSYPVQKHLEYHVWAASRLIQTLGPVDEKIIFQEQKSSFPSIAKTIMHMSDAETAWRLRMEEGISLTEWPSKNFKGGKAELLAAYEAAGKKLRDFVTLKKPDLNSKFAYRNMKGEPYEDIIEETLFHVVNHASYHRGQVVTQLREAGVTSILSMDLVAYFRTLK